MKNLIRPANFAAVVLSCLLSLSAYGQLAVTHVGLTSIAPLRLPDTDYGAGSAYQLLLVLANVDPSGPEFACTVVVVVDTATSDQILTIHGIESSSMFVSASSTVPFDTYMVTVRAPVLHSTCLSLDPSTLDLTESDSAGCRGASKREQVDIGSSLGTLLEYLYTAPLLSSAYSNPEHRFHPSGTSSQDLVLFSWAPTRICHQLAADLCVVSVKPETNGWEPGEEKSNHVGPPYRS